MRRTNRHLPQRSLLRRYSCARHAIFPPQRTADDNIFSYTIYHWILYPTKQIVEQNSSTPISSFKTKVDGSRLSVKQSFVWEERLGDEPKERLCRRPQQRGQGMFSLPYPLRIKRFYSHVTDLTIKFSF